MDGREGTIDAAPWHLDDPRSPVAGVPRAPIKANANNYGGDEKPPLRRRFSLVLCRLWYCMTRAGFGRLDGVTRELQFGVRNVTVLKEETA